MDLLDQVYRQFMPTRANILEAVDEYTLYCFYTEIPDLVPKKRYSSPIRDEGIASFNIFPANQIPDCEFAWKDHGIGISGDIFRLIKLRYGLKTEEEVISLICQDFTLDFRTEKIEAKISLFKKPEVSPVKIKIHSIPFTKQAYEYWAQFGITPKTVVKYNTTQIDYYWTVEDQAYPTSATPMTFAYRVGQYYQLYSPLASKEEKWRTDFPPGYFLGYQQLPETGEILVIDKSNKDVMLDYELGYPATAGKSETTMIPPGKMLEFKTRFKKIFLTLDPDNAGKLQTEKYMKLYPWLEPRFLTQAKDKTDLVKLVGFDNAKTIINQLLT